MIKSGRYHYADVCNNNIKGIILKLAFNIIDYLL
jgi:hypothetical protein